MAKAVIFDMDGVLIFSAREHYQAWREVTDEYGIELEFDAFRATLGNDNRTTIVKILGDRLTDAEIEDMSERKEAIFRSLIAGNFRPVPGVGELIARLRDDGWGMALGTSAPPENAACVLSMLPGGDAIVKRVDSSMVAAAKPAPDIFLKAASLLGTDPADCVVIEDSVSGLTAAKAAGMARLALATSTEEEKLRPLADRVLPDLTGVTTAMLADIIESAGSGD